ncbi:hypothetical protein Clacol_007793 [Clathrus columnatus]|uniref:Exoribonuclease phosphorolytic domain-containing protein n=1 Tax=Clathrus columnatus TaxID=1419009 RepID=A0AAV5ALG0_9AGAM|nr:hypothetical protein Clacol_007793 [Clathrus columnatus]
MPRQDGRSSAELRPIEIVLETLDRVDGSGSFGFGDTKALASVSGPIQARLAVELPSKAYLEVTVRSLMGVAGTEAKSLATTLRSLLSPSIVLTQNPRTLIQLVVQSLTPSNPQDPSLTAAFINASTIALLRTASFPMVGVICAAAVGRLKDSEEERLILDPSPNEISRCDVFGCVAVMFNGTDEGGETVWSSLQGSRLQMDYDALLRLAKTGAEVVYASIRSKFEEASSSNKVAMDAKKVPKHRGARVAVSVGEDDSMSTADE